MVVFLEMMAQGPSLPALQLDPTCQPPTALFAKDRNGGCLRQGLYCGFKLIPRLLESAAGAMKCSWSARWHT